MAEETKTPHDSNDRKPAGPGSPRTYWELVGRDFRRNRLAMFGLLIAWVVATVGVFCPLIANSRPLYIQSVFVDDYDETYFVILDYAHRLDSALDAKNQDEVRNLISGLEESFGRLDDHLEAKHDGRLKEIQGRMVSYFRDPSPGSRADHNAVLSAFEEEFDYANVNLVPQKRFPATRTLAPGEIIFIFLYIFFFVAWFNRKRFKKVWRFLLAVAIPTAVCCLVWMLIWPTVQDTYPYRRLVDSEEFQKAGWPVVRTLVPYGENENLTAENRQPPTFLLSKSYFVPAQHYHLLGTDTNGRDVLSRMVYGARISMLIGIVAVSIYVTIGINLGALAGYFSGWVDLLISRLIEIVLCFPVLFLILAVQAYLKPSIFNIMAALGLVWWTGVARLQRGEFMRIVNQDFVQAVRALGGSNLRIIFLHILPNALGPILVMVSFGIAGSILVESALSFLSFGVPQPMASWGDLLNNGRNDVQGTWWLTVFPGFAIFLTVTCFNLVGEGVRDALDPRRDH